MLLNLDVKKIQVKGFNVREIILNENEQKIVEYIAKTRHSSARANGFDDKQISDHSKCKIDLDGFGGEFAFCKEFNIMPSFVTGKTDKADCIMSDGATVDVKTTDRKNGCLLVPMTKKVEDVDIYALVIKHSDSLFQIIGFRGSEKVICDYGYQYHQNHRGLSGEGYALPQSDLHKWT